MVGYWNKPEQTAEAMVDGGWYLTGDLGYLDPDGYLYLVDRAKDMIVSGGENVYCTEVEDALYTHSAVLEATVFGIPDEQWGEAVHAVVVPRADADGLTERMLIEHCRAQIAGYKIPKSISFQTDPLPKSGPGKVLKRSLRATYWEGRTRQIN
jgi:long-chain acyl-CoA synthetase